MSDANLVHDAFMADIIAHPEDDVPRLILADWLADNGQLERGEFIRVQCELAKLRIPPERTRPVDMGWRVEAGHPSGEERQSAALYWTLSRREKELLIACHNGKNWVPHVHFVTSREMDWYKGKSIIGTAHRGFVNEVMLPCYAWLAHGSALVASTPLERVVLSDKQPLSLLDHRPVFCYSWWKLPTVRNEEDLPDILFDYLSDGEFLSADDPNGFDSFWREYRAEAEQQAVALAQADLSQACLAWARVPVLLHQGTRMVQTPAGSYRAATPEEEATATHVLMQDYRAGGETALVMPREAGVWRTP